MLFTWIGEANERAVLLNRPSPGLSNQCRSRSRSFAAWTCLSLPRSTTWSFGGSCSNPPGLLSRLKVFGHGFGVFLDEVFVPGNGDRRLCPKLNITQPVPRTPPSRQLYLVTSCYLILACLTRYWPAQYMPPQVRGQIQKSIEANHCSLCR